VFTAALFTRAKTWKLLTYPIDGWVDKENVLCAHNGLFSLKKEGNPATCDHVDEP